LYSVEQIPGEELQCFFALAFDKSNSPIAVRPPAEFPALGLRIEAIGEVPDPVRVAFEKIQEERRYYAWYRVLQPEVEMRVLMGVVIYLGLAMAARANGSLRLMHTFCSRFLPGFEYPSAAKWTQSIKKIRKATDW
jgi:hypothetical protein